MNKPSKLISLSAEKSESVLQDKANITVKILVEDKTRVSVQKQLKEQVLAVLKELKSHDKVKAQTLSQSISEKYIINAKKEHEKDGYQGNVTISLISYDFDELNLALEELGEKVEVVNINTSISSKLRKEKEESLTKEAIGQFQSKAKLISESFGFKHYSLEEVEVSNTHDESQYGGHRSYAMSASIGGAMRESAHNGEEFISFIQPREEKLTVSVLGKVSLTNTLFD